MLSKRIALLGEVGGMIKGKKTWVFWWGLIICGLAVVGLFGVFWYLVVLDWGSWMHMGGWRYYVPTVFGGVVFLLIGLYMMISGVKKEEAAS
jgi:hypothetical protein